MLEIGAFVLRTETELLIKSRRVVPGKLLADGFVFRHPHVLPAIKQLGADHEESVSSPTANNIGYAAEPRHVREVPLIGACDFGFWREYFDP